MLKPTTVLLAAVLLMSATSNARAETRAELNATISTLFSFVYFPIAIAKWNAIRCDDAATAANLDRMLRTLASDAGVATSAAAKELSAEEDRCCQLGGQWQKLACDRAEFDRKMATARENVARITEIVRRRDAAS